MARVDEVLCALKQVTEATTKQLAATLGWKQTKVGQVLGMLFWQGVVTRERIPKCAGTFVYRIKVESPPVVPKLLFPVRLAERETEQV